MLNTKLNDRILWFDGDTSVEPNSIESMIEKGINTSHLYVTELTPAIKKFNNLVSKDEQITIKEAVRDCDFSWNIPKKYLTLKVDEYVWEKLYDECVRNGWIDNSAAVPSIQRTLKELKLYESMGLYDVLRTIIYIINTLESKNIVWGVGRGSSVHSYVLYLIGVHDVDSVKYGLEVEEFLRLEG